MESPSNPHKRQKLGFEREITLKEDDPDALLLMLNFAYDQKIPSLDDVDNVIRTARSIRDCLGLYRVGDKYDFAQFRDRVISVFKCSIGWWSMQVRSDDPDPIDAVVHREFCGFVRDVYDIVLMAELKENDWKGHCPRCGGYQLDWRPEMLSYEEDKFS
ncbi:uncharacterized protein J4E87_001061 [Alternaria ethzedia]|uniref:uncharacterized protein n=1 Tax=Alternaria ethzedia TaxID=181014 RepID=UPI0020C443D3|nr:uncharacterized protein J4E87_001061 [Alternaria ethzedia]KAI4633894.1 hypothetical protein J4E87_001061 [Alternaria ethzedia]